MILFGSFLIKLEGRRRNKPQNAPHKAEKARPPPPYKQLGKERETRFNPLGRGSSLSQVGSSSSSRAGVSTRVETPNSQAWGTHLPTLDPRVPPRPLAHTHPPGPCDPPACLLPGPGPRTPQNRSLLPISYSYTGCSRSPPASGARRRADHVLRAQAHLHRGRAVSAHARSPTPQPSQLGVTEGLFQRRIEEIRASEHKSLLC